MMAVLNPVVSTERGTFYAMIQQLPYTFLYSWDSLFGFALVHHGQGPFWRGLEIVAMAFLALFHSVLGWGLRSLELAFALCASLFVAAAA